MSYARFLLFAGLCLAAWGGSQFALTAAPAEPPQEPKKRPALQKFMRAKLSLTQGTLEGLVTEDFNQVILNANALLLLTSAEEWKARDTPLYKQHSEEFKAAVKEMKKMAEKKNADGVALAYLHTTTSCIECHRYTRGRLIAE